MKILFDCIVTAKADRCSTTILFVNLARVLLKHEDVFIYWPLPEYLSEEERDWYPKHERIKYVFVPMIKDRIREYNRMTMQLEDMVCFNGSMWDWDVLVTVRSTMVPLMRIIATSPRQKRHTWTKRIYTLDIMMISSKKPNVSLSNEDVQDRMTIEAYLASDGVFVDAYHERGFMWEMARKSFAASRIKEVNAKFHEVCQLELSQHQPSLKQPPFKYDGSRKLGLAFVGRLSPKDIEISQSVMTNQYILHSSGIRSFICTVSTGGSVHFEDWVQEVLRPNREEFWRICREEMDLVVCFMNDMELNLSRLEPVVYGVPSIFNKVPCFIGMFGEDYPLYAAGATQAYGLVNAFAHDYSAMYEPFARWWKEWFIPTYQKREAEDGMYTTMERYIMQEPENMAERLGSLGTNRLVQSLMKCGGDEFCLTDVIAEHPDQFDHQTVDKVHEERDERSLAFSSAWNEYRLALKVFHGYKDASTKLGHLKRSV